MTRSRKLSRSITLEQFDHGYWYADDLKEFAARLGVDGAKSLRKDELERAIRAVLGGQRAEMAAPRRNLAAEVFTVASAHALAGRAARARHRLFTGLV